MHAICPDFRVNLLPRLMYTSSMLKCIDSIDSTRNYVAKSYPERVKT
jgi:hypothetical protein